jgi:branched-chain amino acid transport system ATP-binding protein
MKLDVQEITAGYRDIMVISGVSVSVKSGEIIGILGANGAGKTTLLRAIAGLLPVRDGDVVLDGESVLARGPHEIARAGLAYVPDGRHLFSAMSVERNLVVGGIRLARRQRTARLGEIYELFPNLATRRNQLAARLSGGEQQMLAIGRALMSDPKLIMLDEPSAGLAPIIVEDLYRTLGRLVTAEVGVLLVEQTVRGVLDLCSHVYVMAAGKVVVAGRPDSISEGETLRAAYLGVAR